MLDRGFSSRILAGLLFVLSCVLSARAVERVVDLTAADGTKLKASYFAAAKPGPGVLLLHQCNRQRKVWDGLAQQLAAAGINVLTLDLRGFGESGGDPFDKLTPQAAQAEAQKWPTDIDAAFRYLVSQPGATHDVIGATYKKALELLPSDTTDLEERRKGIKDSAEQKLKQLGGAAP